MNRAAIILGMGLATVSLGAMAADIGPEFEDDRAMSFDTLDQNNNGVLEEMEVMELQDDHDFEGAEYENIDANRDSEITREEWEDFFVED